MNKTTDHRNCCKLQNYFPFQILLSISLDFLFLLPVYENLHAYTFYIVEVCEHIDSEECFYLNTVY